MDLGWRLIIYIINIDFDLSCLHVCIKSMLCKGIRGGHSYCRTIYGYLSFARSESTTYYVRQGVYCMICIHKIILSQYAYYAIREKNTVCILHLLVLLQYSRVCILKIRNYLFIMHTTLLVVVQYAYELGLLIRLVYYSIRARLICILRVLHNYLQQYALYALMCIDDAYQLASNMHTTRSTSTSQCA